MLNGDRRLAISGYPKRRKCASALAAIDCGMRHRISAMQLSSTKVLCGVFLICPAWSITPLLIVSGVAGIKVVFLVGIGENLIKESKFCVLREGV